MFFPKLEREEDSTKKSNCGQLYNKTGKIFQNVRIFDELPETFIKIPENLKTRIDVQL